MSPRHLVRFVLLLACFLGRAAASGQALPADTTSTDTIRTNDGGTLSGDSPRRAPASADGLQQPVTYSARDSLRIVFARPDSVSTPLQGDSGVVEDRAYLYGDVTAHYGEATLSAGIIELWFESQELRALPAARDSGQTEIPRFSEGTDSFTGQQFVYNLQSRRGRVVGARTQVEDGFLLGGIIKQRDAHIIYAQDAAYTTCELDHPHYALEAGRMKIVDGEWVYTGPVRLSILGIPMPVWLPFGFFPAAEGRRSGPLAISYGEDRSAFGFYLENVGWYWAVSDHFDALARGKLGTLGSYQIDTRFNYVRRYGFEGALDLSYARLRRGESEDPDFAVSQNARIRWTHAQSFTPNTTLNAAVDLTSSSQRFISDAFDDRVTQTSTSSIAFRQNWSRAGRSLSVDARATQQLSTGGANLTLPSLAFSQQRRFPLRRQSLAGRTEAWFERIGVSYSGTLTNTYDFTPLADTVLAGSGFEDVSWVDALFSQSDYEGATGGAVSRFAPEVAHSIPISASFSTQAPFTLNWSPSIRYSENWYTRSDLRSLDSTGAIVNGVENGFTAIRRVNVGITANTEFYGIFPVRIGPFDGLRHTVQPQVSFSYEPDYSVSPFNYFRTVTDTLGQEIEYAIIGGIPNRRTQRLGYGLQNVFQTRRVRTDSTGEESRSVIQLFTLGARSAYDFAAEQRRMADVIFDLTSQRDRYRLRADATFSPYAVDSLGSLTENYYLGETGRLLRLTRLSLSTGASFTSSSAGGRPSLPPPGSTAPFGFDPSLPGVSNGIPGVIDFAIPWSISLDFTYGYSPRIGTLEAQQSAILSVSSFDFSLTPRWKIAGRTGYDFERGELSTTSLSVVRDLHCWEMRFNWIPFGAFSSFNFSIYVKSGHLRDLLRLDLPRSDVQNRFGNLF